MTSDLFELLWRNALGVIPIAVAVALLTRWLPIRPATRHSLWLATLLFLLLPPVLPELGFQPRFGDPETNDQAASTTLSEPRRRIATPAESPPPIARDVREPRPGDQPVRRSVKRAQPAAPRPSAATRPAVRLQIESSLSGAGVAPSAPDGARRADSSNAGRAPVKRPQRERNIPARRAEAGLGEGPGPFVAVPTLQRLNEIRPLRPFAQRTSEVRPLSGARAHAADDAAAPAGKEDRPIPPAPARAGADDRGAPSWFTWLEPWRRYLAEAQRVLVAAPPIPASIWLLGGLAALAALGARTWSAARMFAHATPAPGAVRRRVQRAARDLGLRDTPETVMVARPVSPMIWCGRRLRLVLPEQLWNELDDVGREAVVRHELAHLKRRDHWIRRIEMLVGALYWWHPVVWWIRRRIEEEADYCCDVWVTALMPEHRSAYARALLQTRQYVSQGGGATPVWGVGAASTRKRRFARRLTMVMTHRLKPTMSLAGLALAAAVATAGAVSTPIWACPPEEKAPRAQVAAHEHEQEGEAPEAEPGKSTFEEYVEGKQSRDEDDCDSDRESEVESIEIDVDMDCEDARAQAMATLEQRLASLNQRLRSTIAGGPIAAPGAAAPPAPRAMFAGDQELIDRTYSLPQDRLEKLSDLMVRDDVPILVRPDLDDGEILVRATRAHHRVFADFVNLLNPEQRVESYRLSEGKLEDLTELMALSTVPTLITPGEEDIKVHGDGVTQSVFGAFVEMIDPEGPAARAAAPRAPAAPAPPSPQSRALQAEAEKVRAKSMALMQEAQNIRAMISSMQGQAANVRSQAEAVYGQAERHWDRAGKIREKAEELRERAEETDEPRRYELMVRAESLETEAETMERMGEVLERQAEMLEEQSEAIEERTEELEERIEELETEAEELREALREQVEGLEEELEERASAIRAALGEQYEALEATYARRAEEIVRWLERDR